MPEAPVEVHFHVSAPEPDFVLVERATLERIEELVTNLRTLVTDLVRIIRDS